MYKLAPTRKRPKRVAKKIERRFGLAHYDRGAIFSRCRLLAVIKRDTKAGLPVLSRVFGERQPSPHPTEEGSSVKAIPVMRPAEFITINFSLDTGELEDSDDGG